MACRPRPCDPFQATKSASSVNRRGRRHPRAAHRDVRPDGPEQPRAHQPGPGDRRLARAGLGDAIAAETGVDDPQQRIVAAHLASVHRVLFAEGARRSLAGQPRDEICQVLAAAARRAFDLLEPSLGGYGVRA
jgi:hypothetical protein